MKQVDTSLYFFVAPMFKVRINATRYFYIRLVPCINCKGFQIILGVEHPDYKKHPDDQVTWMFDSENPSQDPRNYQNKDKYIAAYWSWSPKWRGKVGKVLNPYGNTEFFVAAYPHVYSEGMKSISVGWIHNVDGAETYSTIHSVNFIARHNISYIGLMGSDTQYADMKFEILNGRL